MTAKEIYEAAQMFFPPPPLPSLKANQTSRASDSSGVYFLYSEQRLLYVGESLSIRRRLGHHEHKGKFDSFGWLNCASGQRKRLEAFYIGLLNPPLNHQSTYFARAKCGGKRSVRQEGHLSRRLLRFIDQHPGCTKTQLHKAVGWHKGADDVNRVLNRMADWRFIRIEFVETAGRRKSLFFRAQLDARATVRAG
jgi:hypothetical protein